MRISDWSSDVCSSDLTPFSASSSSSAKLVSIVIHPSCSRTGERITAVELTSLSIDAIKQVHYDNRSRMLSFLVGVLVTIWPTRLQIGRASWRERGCQSV